MAINKGSHRSNKIYLNRNVKNEVKLLRSFVMSLIKEDKEGKYNPRFIKEVLKAVKEKPTHSFLYGQTFLKELR